MFKKSIITILLCVNSYKTLGECKKPENILNKIPLNISQNLEDNIAEIKKEKIYIKGETGYSYMPLLEKDRQITEFSVYDASNDFEGLYRVKNDDIHLARKRKLIQNCWLKPNESVQQFQSSWQRNNHFNNQYQND